MTLTEVSNATPLDLENRRKSIIETMRTQYKGYDDPEVPESLLQELAIITSSLRRKNAGPPKTDKKPRAKGPTQKFTSEDL